MSNFSEYSAAGPGYGFTATSGDTNADPGSVYGTTLTFQVDLPDGSYQVTPTLGFQGDASDTAAVYLQGSEVDVLPTGSGAQTRSYVATVAQGHLTLELMGAGYDTQVHLQQLVIMTAAAQSSTAGGAEVGETASGWTLYPGHGQGAALNDEAATNVPYSIDDGSGLLSAASVNQQVAPSGPAESSAIPWERIGTFTVSGGAPEVKLSNLANVEADAVEIPRVHASPLVRSTWNPPIQPIDASGASEANTSPIVVGGYESSSTDVVADAGPEPPTIPSAVRTLRPYPVGPSRSFGGVSRGGAGTLRRFQVASLPGAGHAGPWIGAISTGNPLLLADLHPETRRGARPFGIRLAFLERIR